MNVLITGATTGLGERLLTGLVADPAVDRIVAVCVESPSRLPRDLQQAAVWIQTDLARSRNVRELLFGPALDLEVHAVVHAAQRRRADLQGSEVHRLHVTATRLMLRLCEKHPTIRRFVFRSSGELYRTTASTPTVLREDAALDLDPRAPQWVRDRVEADLAVCARVGLSELQVAVLRCAEILAPGVGSQLHDYLQSRVCFRPVGFDPVLNLLSVEDGARALRLALHTDAIGVFNVPGADTLPLSRVISRWGRVDVQIPGGLVGWLYRWRQRAKGTDFRYDMNRDRFHFTGLLDGSRAERVLGYRPEHPIARLQRS